MNVNDEKRFSELLALAATHYKYDLSVLIIDMYWECLKQFEFDDVKKAIYAHLQNPDGGQFMPKVADIIGIIKRSKGIDGKSAWLAVMDEIRRVGSYSAPDVPERSLEAIRRVGGWRHICSMTTEQLAFLGNKFVDEYLQIEELEAPKMLEAE